MNWAYLDKSSIEQLFKQSALVDERWVAYYLDENGGEVGFCYFESRDQIPDQIDVERLI